MKVFMVLPLMALALSLSGCSPAPIYLSTPVMPADRIAPDQANAQSAAANEPASGDWTLLLSQGTASYYGKEFHGRKTANGERFDMNALTAAHRTLPFGTIVRVTGLKSGKSVRVRINDRGPFVTGRDIDLSYAAAKAIDQLSLGPVKLEVLNLKPKGAGR